MPPDLLVAGAGPAGVAAALTAADRGLDVVLVDKARFPRDKTCGDGLTTAALRRLESLGLDLLALRDRGAYETVRETVVVSPSGRRILLTCPDDGHDGEYVGVTRRADLDAALVDLARDRGVEIREAVAVTDVVNRDGTVKVALADGTALEPRYLVAADGHYSTVRRALAAAGGRAAPDRGTWHAQRQYFRGVETRRIWVVFVAGMLPGYAWVFPLPGGRANVGFGVSRHQARSGHDMAALWRIVLDHPAVGEALGPHAEPEGRPRAWPIPCDFDPGRLAAGRVLFVGDAAAVVDPMTGEGVAQALQTGQLAAEAIAGGDTTSAADPTVVAGAYRDSVVAALGTDLRFAQLLQRVLRHRKGTRAALRLAGSTPWTRRQFARWLYEDYPRAVILTPRRWHRGMFTGPGAYRRQPASP